MPISTVEAKLTGSQKNDRAGKGWEGVHKETGAKTERLRQRGSTVLQHWTI